MHFDVLLYPGFDELDALAPWEILSGLAETLPAQHSAALVTLEGTSPVTASHGAVITPHAALAERPDVLVVPGGGWSARDGSPGAWATAQEGSVPAAVAERHARGTVVASVCTGAMVVAATGLLAGRPATTHHSALADLEAAGAELVPGARVIDDGDLVSAGGVTSGLDLGLWLLERFVGPQVALLAERELEYERRGTVWRRA
ncbi:MAG: ThiJ/PfpI domain protein [Solirubrobacterales bacterium]|jgi:transcriptional regulator GlxA family with amidase domain|nr:ThiJ/PfpI domain protein [Solirubrobacterales bacterium]